MYCGSSESCLVFHVTQVYKTYRSGRARHCVRRGGTLLESDQKEEKELPTNSSSANDTRTTMVSMRSSAPLPSAPNATEDKGNAASTFPVPMDRSEVDTKENSCTNLEFSVYTGEEAETYEGGEESVVDVVLESMAQTEEDQEMPERPEQSRRRRITRRTVVSHNYRDMSMSE
jgi:hypothetical protein